MKAKPQIQKDTVSSEVQMEEIIPAPIHPKNYGITEINELLKKSKLTDCCSKRNVVHFIASLKDESFIFLDGLRSMSTERLQGELAADYLLRLHIKSCMDSAVIDLLNAKK